MLKLGAEAKPFCWSQTNKRQKEEAALLKLEVRVEKGTIVGSGAEIRGVKLQAGKQ